MSSSKAKTAGSSCAPVLPIEAQVRAEDIESSEAGTEGEDDGAGDGEAEPGKGENAPGFLKREKKQPGPQ
jgi:hypothetical protein